LMFCAFASKRDATASTEHINLYIRNSSVDYQWSKTDST
jgi:hypothetical protein